MPKRNSKSSNAYSVVVVRSTASKMGAFSSSCSKLCNEWSFMSVRRAEAELHWFKRTLCYPASSQCCPDLNRDNTGTMRDNTGTGHTAGDHVLVTAILSAIFIVTLVYLLVLGQPFRFRRLERAGTPPRQQQAPVGSMVRRRQDFCPVFSAPSATTQEATTLSQTTQRCEAHTTSTSASTSARNIGDVRCDAQPD